MEYPKYEYKTENVRGNLHNLPKWMADGPAKQGWRIVAIERIVTVDANVTVVLMERQVGAMDYATGAEYRDGTGSDSSGDVEDFDNEL